MYTLKGSESEFGDEWIDLAKEMETEVLQKYNVQKNGAGKVHWGEIPEWYQPKR